MGTVVIGKVESGKCQKGDLLLVMPNRVSHSKPAAGRQPVEN